jgi:hypothetical protein
MMIKEEGIARREEETMIEGLQEMIGEEAASIITSGMNQIVLIYLNIGGPIIGDQVLREAGMNPVEHTREAGVMFLWGIMTIERMMITKIGDIIVEERRVEIYGKGEMRWKVRELAKGRGRIHLQIVQRSHLNPRVKKLLLKVLKAQNDRSITLLINSLI